MYPLDAVIISSNKQTSASIWSALAETPVQVALEFHDVAEAIAALTPEADVRKLLLLVHVRNSEDLGPLRQLLWTFAGWPILAIVDTDGAHDIALSVMRAGAAQVVMAPIQTEKLRSALECIALQFGCSKREGKLIAVASVAGGCGGTTVALNLADEVSIEENAKCVLVEWTRQIGALPAYLDMAPRFSTQDLFSRLDDLDLPALDGLLTRVRPRLAVLPGPTESMADVSISVDQAIQVLGQLRCLADVVILDVPCVHDELYFKTMTAADELVLVVEQELPSVRVLALHRRELIRRGIDRPQTIVVNRYCPNVAGFHVNDFQRMFATDRVLTIANDHSTAINAVNHGRFIRKECSRSPIVVDLHRLGHTLQLIAHNGVHPPKSGLFRRWFGDVLAVN